MPLVVLKTTGFKWTKIGGKKFVQKTKSEGSSAAAGAAHY